MGSLFRADPRCSSSLIYSDKRGLCEDVCTDERHVRLLTNK